jgi:hypothetical protein
MVLRPIALLVTVSALLASASTAEAKPKVVKPSSTASTFNREAATKALAQIDLAKCKVSGGPRGKGLVSMTFETNGHVADVKVEEGDFAKSPVARCIVARYQVASVPPFTGEAVRVRRAFLIE